ncbi:unnamed protein product [Sphagnum balticum]
MESRVTAEQQRANDQRGEQPDGGGMAGTACAVSAPKRHAALTCHIRFVTVTVLCDAKRKVTRAIVHFMIDSSRKSK